MVRPLNEIYPQDTNKVDWIHLFQGRVQGLLLVNISVNL
jgi:hypothetical protein